MIAALSLAVALFAVAPNAPAAPASTQVDDSSAAELLKGRVTTRVSFNNDGKACERPRHFTFRITSGRKYLRLKEMDNCEGNRVMDYVDIYFERPLRGE